MTTEAPIKTRFERQHVAGGLVYFLAPPPSDAYHVEVAFVPDGASGSTGRSHSSQLRFQDLADWWHAETDGLSSDAQKHDHEAYQRILNELGKTAIPFMLEDLRHRGGHWYAALRQLTGESVDASAKGSMRRARELWLRWGKAEHLI